MNAYVALSGAVRTLLAQPAVVETISRLKGEVEGSPEPFVWATLDLSTVAARMPNFIRSGWIFVLKKDAWSGAHFHPNSVQHMVVIEGRGRSLIAGALGDLSPIESAEAKDRWVVIEPGVPHEFYPVSDDMVVMSFHTCAAAELVEVSAADGRSRTYANEL